MTPILNCSYPVSNPSANTGERFFRFSTYFSKSCMILSPRVVRLAFLRQPDLGLRCFLRLLLKGICQYEQLPPGKEAEQSECVAANINPDFPYVVRVDQLLQVVGWYTFQVPNHAQHPGNLLNGLVRQVVKMLLNRTPPGQHRVERNRSHC